MAYAASHTTAAAEHQAPDSIASLLENYLNPRMVSDRPCGTRVPTATPEHDDRIAFKPKHPHVISRAPPTAHH